MLKQFGHLPSLSKANTSFSIDLNGNWNESLGLISFSCFLFTSFQISVTVVSQMYFIRYLAFY